MSPTLVRLCPSCKVARITTGRRCPPCQATYDRARGSPTARGYGAGYQAVRRRVFERDGYRCRWCAGWATTIDHVVPLSQGGDSSEGNLAAACLRCNSGRRSAPRR